MQARRLRMVTRRAPLPSYQYWLGAVETNQVYSPCGANLTYWTIDANMTANYNTTIDALVLGRTSVNNWNLYTKPHTNVAKSRPVLAGGQTIIGGAEVTASHACRAVIDLALYDTATGWNYVSGNRLEMPLTAGQSLPMPLQCTVPTALSTYYLEYQIGFLTPLDANGSMPVSMPANATLTVRNASLFVDQLPRDGLFGGNSPGVTWQGTPNASSAARRVATPKTHFTPPTSTVTLAGTTYATAQVATPPAAFTPTSVWNRPASTLNPIADSDVRLRWLAGSLGTSNNRFVTSGQMGTTWGVPTYYADSTSPTYQVTRRSGGTPVSWNSIRIPLGARAAANADGEMTVYDIERGVVWWFWLAQFDGTNWSAQAASVAYLDGNGIAAGMTNGDVRNVNNTHNGKNGHICHWRWSEFAAGDINRVIRVALPNTYGSNQAVWPVSYSDGLSTNPLAIPQGAILRLKPSIDIQTTFPHVPDVGKIMLRQMQNYGIMYVDSGGSEPGFIVEDTYYENGLARWPFGFNPLPGVKLADSGATNATVYFDVCYPQP